MKLYKVCSRRQKTGTEPSHEPQNLGKGRQKRIYFILTFSGITSVFRIYNNLQGPRRNKTTSCIYKDTLVSWAAPMSRPSSLAPAAVRRVVKVPTGDEIRQVSLVCSGLYGSTRLPAHVSLSMYRALHCVLLYICLLSCFPCCTCICSYMAAHTHTLRFLDIYIYMCADTPGCTDIDI